MIIRYTLALVLLLAQAPTDAQRQQLRDLRDALTAALEQATAPASVGTVAHTSAEFQAALDTAAPGSVILLDAGARYVGNFILPARPAGNAPITVMSKSPSTQGG